MIVATVGDVAVGTCVCPVPPFPATGTVVTGDPQFTTSGKPLSLVGTSVVMFPCGSSVIVSGAPQFLSTGTMLGRLGDSVVGCGVGTLVGTSTIISA